MGILHIATIAAISLTSLLPASCRKTAVKTSTSASVAAANTTTNTAHELGELTLTNHLETCVHLGSGKSCFFTPRMIDRHSFQLTLALESKSESGRTRDLNVTEVVAKTDKPFELAIGDFQLSFTPHVAVE
jgi:hypothetical protein